MRPASVGAEALARLIVAAAGWVMRHRIALSGIGLVVAVVVAGSYVAVSALHRNPTDPSFVVRVLLPDSGGLLATQNVTVRGINVGHIESVSLTADGVEALARINGAIRIPKDSPVRVSALSAAGEQFLEFRPAGSDGPYLDDGSAITVGNDNVPVSLAQLLENARGVAAQLDTHKLSAVMNELRVSRRGPEKLTAILDGGMFLVSTLDSVLPETVSVLRNSRVVFTTIAEANAGLAQTTANTGRILDGVNAMEGGYRTLVDRGASQFSTFDTLLNDNRETMLALLGNLTTTSQLFYKRLPALEALFPSDRGSVLDAVASVFHDGGMWGIGDIYPRYSCDYDLPRRPPSQPDSVEPYLNTYCKNPDPAVLVRGARNAPRPPGEEDTSGPPAGLDPLAQTDPTPVGRWTMPMPYGGPVLPAVLPP